jgi:hypothetical protein
MFTENQRRVASLARIDTAKPKAASPGDSALHNALCVAYPWARRCHDEDEGMAGAGCWRGGGAFAI